MIKALAAVSLVLIIVWQGGYQVGSSDTYSQCVTGRIERL